MTNCVFCDPEKMKADTLKSYQHFFEKVGFALVTPGQSMLISTSHLQCFGELSEELDEEYLGAKKSLRERVSREFSEPFLMEMGVWGQSVNHAHTHFIPLKGEGYSLNSAMEEMVLSGPDKVRYTRVKNLGELKEIYRSEGKYVSIEEHDQLYVCHVEGITFDPKNLSPNLTYGGFFSQKIGLSGTGNWKDMTQADKTNDEIKRNMTKNKLTA